MAPLPIRETVRSHPVPSTMPSSPTLSLSRRGGPDPAAPPMSVLQVITPSRFAGAERMVVLTARALQRHGHRVAVAAKPLRALELALEREGITAHSMLIGGKLNLLAPLLLARLARKLGVDLIHTHLSTASVWGSVAGRLCGVPVVATAHALNHRTCFRAAHLVIACSDAVREHFIRQGHPPGRIWTVRNAIDTAPFERMPPPSVARARLGLPVEGYFVGVVAHLTARKGHAVLLEALGALSGRWPHLHAVFAGDGPLRETLRRDACGRGIGDRAHFLGHCEDVRMVYSACDVIALPSVGREGLPLVLLEAGAAGVPSVASRVAGTPEVIVDGETGFLTTPGDVPALADAIDRLLRNPVLRLRMGKKARGWVHREFSLDRFTWSLEAVYRRVLSGELGRNPLTDYRK